MNNLLLAWKSIRVIDIVCTEHGVSFSARTEHHYRRHPSGRKPMRKLREKNSNSNHFFSADWQKLSTDESTYYCWGHICMVSSKNRAAKMDLKTLKQILSWYQILVDFSKSCLLKYFWNILIQIKCIICSLVIFFCGSCCNDCDFCQLIFNGDYVTAQMTQIHHWHSNEICFS